MNKKFAFFGLCFFTFLGSAFHSYTLEDINARLQTDGKTLVLYDAALGGLPDAPLMSFTDFPLGTALPAYSNGATVLDTTISGNDIFAGWTANGATTPGFPLLDRTAGFQLDFTLQIENEAHRTNNRSGFSLILLSEDTRGIELAFWENEIWAQSDGNTGGLFNHAEGIVFPTTTGMIEYRLAVTGDTYTLTANMQPILSGPLRDYSEFDGFPDPYQTPNFLFLGDNTTSAQARVRLRFVSITGTQPVMPTGTIESTKPSSGTPLPAASPTAPLSLTPVPSPTPAGKGLEFCPSGGLILALMVASTMVLRGVRAKFLSEKCALGGVPAAGDGGESNLRIEYKSKDGSEITPAETNR